MANERDRDRTAREAEPRRAWLASIPHQRLQWLEEAKAFVERARAAAAERTARKPEEPGRA